MPETSPQPILRGRLSAAATVAVLVVLVGVGAAIVRLDSTRAAAATAPSPTPTSSTAPLGGLPITSQLPAPLGPLVSRVVRRVDTVLDGPATTAPAATRPPRTAKHSTTPAHHRSVRRTPRQVAPTASTATGARHIPSSRRSAPVHHRSTLHGTRHGYAGVPDTHQPPSASQHRVQGLALGALGSLIRPDATMMMLLGATATLAILVLGLLILVGRRPDPRVAASAHRLHVDAV